jgi:hypothetical protein
MLSVYSFEKNPLAQVLSAEGYTSKEGHIHDQFGLIDL